MDGSLCGQHSQKLQRYALNLFIVGARSHAPHRGASALESGLTVPNYVHVGVPASELFNEYISYYYHTIFF
jgi:hypothetical protein